MVLSIPQDVSLHTIGKVANKVYYEIQGEKRVRSYVIPVQPGTGQQRRWWAQFRLFVHRWQALLPAQKAQWDVQGDIFRMTGFNKFMSENLKEVA